MLLQKALRCPSVPMGIQIPSLLDSGSEVMLLKGSLVFDQHLLSKIKLATSEKAKAHQLFNLTVANDGQLPVNMYTKLDITFLGLKVPNVGILVVEDPSQVPDKKHPSNLPGIVGWNLVQLSYNAFVEKYGTSGFSFFTCPNMSITIQTQVEAVGLECLPKLCPNNRNK